jgi:methylenetetrahydrofolate dehydrogenase (NADP+)/methenyltetrahydrofolate cyclohydrolase
MKLLNGQELAGFIKGRHAGQVRALLAQKITPKLAIVQVKDDRVIGTYVRLKCEYGKDIGAQVDVHKPTQKDIPKLLKQLNSDTSVHGIIIQLPLIDTSETDRIVNLVAPEKDVDALRANPEFDPATPMAILWLLAGYNIDLAGKKIWLIGRGKLVGAPLEKMLKNSGYNVTVIDKDVEKMADKTREAEILITATGKAGIIKPEMIGQNAVVVDAGTASEGGKTIGDLAPEVYERDDLTITPSKGGVGPLTVCALFENVIYAADKTRTQT